jgi:trigger factor
MQINTKELEYCKLKVSYVADPDTVKKEREKVLESIKNYSCPGFRKGKAPNTALKLKYSHYINSQIEDNMTQTANDDILFDTKMRPIGNPQLVSRILKDNTFECEFVYVKKPDFELAPYKYDIPDPDVGLTVDNHAELILQQLREKVATVCPYEENDFVQAGDTITISYTSSTGEEKEGEIYKIGTNLDWDCNLLGAKAGDVREFNLTKDGADVHYTVNIHMGMKSVIAPLDDELAKKYGLNSLAELETQVKQTVSDQQKQAKDGKIANQIKLRLLEDNKFEIPAFLKTNEAQLIANHEGKKWEELSDEEKDSYLLKASNNVRLALILDSIRLSDPECDISEQEAISMLQQVLLERGQDANKILGEAQKNGSLFGLVASARNDFVMKYLIDNATLIK